MLSPIVSTRADTFERIVSKGYVAVCFFDNRLPFSSRGEEPSGIQVDLAQALVDRLGLRLDTRWVAYRFHARQAGCDVQMGTISRANDDDDDANEDTSERALNNAAGRVFNLKNRIPPRQSIPYFASKTFLITGSDLNQAKDYSDLDGHRVAVMDRSWAHYLLIQNDIPLTTRFKTELEILQAVESGEMDGGIVSNIYFGWYRLGEPGSVLRVASGFAIDPELDFNVAISLRGADDALVDRVNAVLKGLIADDTVKGIYEKYGISYSHPHGSND
jgi:polar amino acid transport system substrate-binding protein